MTEEKSKKKLMYSIEAGVPTFHTRNSIPTMSQIKLGFNTHGKGRVRLVKVIRKADGTHDVQQLSVQILLEGDNMEKVFTTGDNSPVVATDTCKNTVYCLAKLHDFNSIEEFGIILCNHFLGN